MSSRPVGPNRDLLITIDGPAGAGKSTVSRLLAGRLGYRHIDTGALYRGIAYEALRRQVSIDDDDALGRLCEGMELKFEFEEGICRLFSDGKDISGKIRTSEVTAMASKISAKAVVRAHLLSMQRKLGAQKQAVFEGRDMGTVVFPDADVKFFLTADLRVRARRRLTEISPPGDGRLLERMTEDIRRRDESDSRRALAPLVDAEDAVHIDSTSLTIEEVVEKMLGVVLETCP